MPGCHTLKIGVVGVGYVGLSTAVCVATKYPTVAVDLDRARVSNLKAGKVPIHEKGLQRLLDKGLAAKRLLFSSSSEDVMGADVIFIAVGTPSGSDGSIELSQVRSSCAGIGGVIKRTKSKPLVLMKSTAVPGTARNVVKPILEESSNKTCGTGFGLCSNPEFLREGTAIQDTLGPDRVVLGPFDELSLRLARGFFQGFYGKNGPPSLVTTPEGAELVKYGSNALLATKVSFINLIAGVCERFPGTDVDDVARGIGMDHRIGPHFLQAGPGFGGSCFSKDVHAFSKSIGDSGLDSSILDSILEINEAQPHHVVKLAEKAADSLQGKEIAVLGLAFKAGTDDIRESRSIPLIQRLLEIGGKVRVYDPVAMPAAKTALASRVVYSSSTRDCIKGADVAIIMTAWRQFKSLKPGDYLKLMRSPVIVDARRVYDPRNYAGKLRYAAVGIGTGSGFV
jgi:UDPglucose 6-dehydrogenase